TALRQREAATALLEAAGRSYDAALESYNYGLRNLLDVTAAQRILAQARSTDVLARTQVLTTLAALAFRAGDSIQLNAMRARPCPSLEICALRASCPSCSQPRCCRVARGHRP